MSLRDIMILAPDMRFKIDVSELHITIIKRRWYYISR